MLFMFVSHFMFEKKTKDNIFRSPGTRRKNRAPRPPPSSSSLCQPTSTEQAIYQNISSEQKPPEQTLNENLTGNQIAFNKEEKQRKILISVNLEELFPQCNRIKKMHKRHLGGSLCFLLLLSLPIVYCS